MTKTKFCFNVASRWSKSTNRQKSDLLFRMGPTLLWPFLDKRPLLPVLAFVGEGDCILSEGGWGTAGGWWVIPTLRSRSLAVWEPLESLLEAFHDESSIFCNFGIAVTSQGVKFDYWTVNAHIFVLAQLDFFHFVQLALIMCRNHVHYVRVYNVTLILWKNLFHLC